MLRLRHLSVGTIVLAFLASSASATLFRFEGMGLYSKVTFSYAPDPSTLSKTQSVYAGQIKIHLGDLPNLLSAYCVDLDHTVKSSWTASPQPVSSLGPRGSQVAYLYETFGPKVDSNAKAAALQVAIWETLYDGNADLYGGRFMLHSSTGAGLFEQAKMYMLSIPKEPTPAASTVVLHSGNSPRSQDLVVPESMSLVLVALGSLPLLLRWPQTRRED